MKTTKTATKTAPFEVGETVLCAWHADSDCTFDCPLDACWSATVVDIKRRFGYESGWAVSVAGAAHGTAGPLDSAWIRKIPKTSAVVHTSLAMTAGQESDARRESGRGPYAHRAALVSCLAEIDALREARRTDTERIRREECNRCVSHVSRAADDARASNRKKAAAELDMLARDIADGRPT